MIMASIKNILNIAAQTAKLNKNSSADKPAPSEKADKSDNSGNKVSAKDSARISETARELAAVKTEAEHYVQTVKESDESEPQNERIQAVRENIENDHYSRPEVVDRIVDKLLNLPNYLKQK